MAYHILRIVRSAATLYDFQVKTTNVLSKWSPMPYTDKSKTVDDPLVLNPTGTSIANVYDNLNTLYQVLEDAKENYRLWQEGKAYTPIFLQFRQDGATNTMWSEVLGGETQQLENFISGALRAKLLPNLQATLKRRPYFEEESAQSLASSASVTNNGDYTQIASIRGDVPAPLKIVVRAGANVQDRIIVGVKAKGTVANFVCRYEAESYAARGANVADLTSHTNFSNSAGQRWTPASTSEQRLLVWHITVNVSDQLGSYRVYVRCRDKKATFNTKIRVRSGVYTSGGSYQWGDYADTAKYGDGTGTVGGSNALSADSAVASLVDCGIITLPPFDTQGIAPATLAIELRGQATATGAGNEFDVDCIYLMPVMELPCGSGLQVVTFPTNMANGGVPDGIIDSHERNARAYLDDTGVLQHPASDIRGNPLYAWCNKTMRMFVLTLRTDQMGHNMSATSTVTVTSVPRHRYARGT